ncbi:MAG: heavy metal translocating P-type ATPase [Desulfovibrionaceae bacterium]|nr:heavy metal translocating P-type ATPase [Desulfovibrionaceae bacterium]
MNAASSPHCSCCGHSQPPAKPESHEQPCRCPNESAAPAPLAPAALGAASATRAMYRIMNMDCPMEEALIRAKLASVPGIQGLEFNLMQRVLIVNHSLPSTEPIEAALRAIDMTPESLAPAGADAARQAQASPEIPWRRLAVAGALAAASEACEWLRESGVTPEGGLALILPLILAVAAILCGGLGTYRKGWLAVRNLNLNINALMSVAVTGALLIGQYPEAAMVMVLFNLSEAIEAKSFGRARNAIRELLSLAPETATVLRPDGAWESMEARRVPVGARVRVRPGERVALDGVIVAGHSAVNQAPITGESLPVDKGVGDPVFAGSINESGSFECEVTAEAGDSTLARIIHAVEEAQGSRAPIQRVVDSFARVYTPAIFLAALLVALIPPLFLNGDWPRWIYTALVLLVIGCPCALVISTPVTLVSGMAAATRHGLLIKGGAFLEQGRKLQWISLDKTGTLTHGRPRQTDFVPLGGLPGDQALRLAASLAARSDHPVSRAVAEAAGADGALPGPAELTARLAEVDDFQALPGRGVSGVIEGRPWRLGNLRLTEEAGPVPDEVKARVHDLEKQGKSVVILSGDAGPRALFAVADTLRDSAVEAVADLHSLGVRTLMLTGDNEHSAAAMARQAGVDEYRSGLLPEDKLTEVERMQAGGAVVGMAGDGINDAPALARADIGFAMAAAGTDTAMETADVALMDDDLRKIPRFIRLSRATHAILVQNISLALGVKALFLLLTMLGQATMWMAVFADVGTSLLVVANGLRAMRL